MIILVDKDKEFLLTKYTWSVDKYGYARTRITIDSKTRLTVRLHRLILQGISTKLDIDHINGNKLDNRLSNLRVCTRSQNAANSKKHKDGKCQYKGVTFEKKKKLYRARIRVDGKLIGLGRYKVELEAAKAYNTAALKYFGEYAKLNKIGE